MENYEYKQPEFTQKMKDKLNELCKMLRVRSYTKQELMKHFDTGERQVRMMITHISHKLPVISVSSDSGYKIATTKEDFDEVNHTWAELSSRMEELEKRIFPLIKFLKKNEKSSENQLQ